MIESFCEPINCFLLKKSLAEQTGEARHMIERFECQRCKPFEGDLGLCFAETFEKLCCVECHLMHPEQVFMLHQRNFFVSLKVGCGNGIG